MNTAVLDLTPEERVAGGYTCASHPTTGCQFRASRLPSGMCGIHDNQRKRKKAQQAADLRRAVYARDTMARIGPLARALTALGIDAQPRLSGVLITIDGAERLVARLTTHTEGAAQ